MVWKSDAPTTLELSLCSGSEGSPWSLAPKPLLPPLSKLPCELADFPLELLGFLTLKYMLFVSPLKFSPLLLETQCLYNFSQLFQQKFLPRKAPCFVRAISPPVLHARHALHVVLTVGCLGGQQEQLQLAAVPALRAHPLLKKLRHAIPASGCAAVCHSITSSLSFSESGFFLALGSSAAAFFIPFPPSEPWIWSLFIRQYLLKWLFFCPIKYECSAGTCTEQKIRNSFLG